MSRHTTDAFSSNNCAALMLALGARAFGVLALSVLKGLANFGTIPHHLGHLLPIHRLA
jgi:hypothetical protein